LAYDEGHGISENIFEELCSIALFLRKLEGFTGKRMCLALEPEPDCLLESTQTTIDFFERLWRHPLWVPAYRHYIGICFDTCHFALGYEDPLHALRSIVSANIPVARIQVSAALEFNRYTTVEDLRPFIDQEYLHQTRRRDAAADLDPIAFKNAFGHQHLLIGNVHQCAVRFKIRLVQRRNSAESIDVRLDLLFRLALKIVRINIGRQAKVLVAIHFLSSTKEFVVV
jgi:hypothetical protein